MSALLTLILSSPEIQGFVFAAIGGVVGWFVKHRQGDSSVPADLAGLLKVLLQRQQESEAQGKLANLFGHIPIVTAQTPAPVVSPAAAVPSVVQVPAVVTPAVR